MSFMYVAYVCHGRTRGNRQTGIFTCMFGLPHVLPAKSTTRVPYRCAAAAESCEDAQAARPAVISKAGTIDLIYRLKVMSASKGAITRAMPV